MDKITVEVMELYDWLRPRSQMAGTHLMSLAWGLIDAGWTKGVEDGNA